MNRSRTFAFAGLIALAGVGCTADRTSTASSRTPAAGAAALPTAPLTASEVRAVAHTMLLGFDNGEYAAFSRHWDDALKAGVGQQAFESFQRRTSVETGSYQAITGIDQRPGATAGTTNFFIHAQFSEQPMVLRLNIRNDSRLISGVELTKER